MHITSHSQGDSAKKVDHHTTHTYVALKGKSTNGKIEEDHMGLHLDGIFRLHTLGVAARYKRRGWIYFRKESNGESMQNSEPHIIKIKKTHCHIHVGASITHDCTYFLNRNTTLFSRKEGDSRIISKKKSEGWPRILGGTTHQVFHPHDCRFWETLQNSSL